MSAAVAGDSQNREHRYRSIADNKLYCIRKSQSRLSVYPFPSFFAIFDELMNLWMFHRFSFS